LNLENEPYSIQILTVATKLDKIDATKMRYDSKSFEFSKINEHEGVVGQAILAYKSGGRLIMSSCHWISLTNINTTEETVFKTYESKYGTEYSNKTKSEYYSLSKEQQNEQLQVYANYAVQKSAPCKYSNKKL